MKYDYLKSCGCYILVLYPQIFKNYEISTNVSDNNTKFTTKSEDVVICGSGEIYIYINLYVKFTCLLHVHILFNVSKLFRSYSIV